MSGHVVIDKGEVVIEDSDGDKIDIRTGGILGVSGTIAVSSIPNISGTVSVDSMPNVEGTVAISSMPNVEGTVSVDNTVNISGTISLSDTTVNISTISSGTVSLSDTTVNISTILSGTVSLSNTTVNISDKHTDAPCTNSVVTIDHTHHEIHAGRHFYINSYEDVGTNDSIAFLIEPGAVDNHTFFNINFEVEGEALLKEGITYNTAGTVVSPINSDFNSTASPIMAISMNPSTVTGGTIKVDNRVGSGRSNGGAVRNDSEKILKQNTDYYLKLFNRSGSASNVISWDIGWYEE